MNMVNKPNHYIGIDGLEVEEVLRNFIPRYENSYTGHRAASALEYILRAPQKNGLEDWKKARQNLDQLIEYEESKVDTSYADAMTGFANIKIDDETEINNAKINENKAISTFYGGVTPLD